MNVNVPWRIVHDVDRKISVALLPSQALIWSINRQNQCYVFKVMRTWVEGRGVLTGPLWLVEGSAPGWPAWTPGRSPPSVPWGASRDSRTSRHPAAGSPYTCAQYSSVCNLPDLETANRFQSILSGSVSRQIKFKKYDVRRTTSMLWIPEKAYSPR